MATRLCDLTMLLVMALPWPPTPIEAMLILSLAESGLSAAQPCVAKYDAPATAAVVLKN